MPLEIPPLVVSLVVVPLIGFMVLMKWKSTAARKAKIRELLSLVSEEACMAEAAAVVEYINSTSTVLDRLNQCAVCFSPTASRCSRCKAVRYCSGKCQIVHWRQGHKQECQPADTSMLDSPIWLTTKEKRSFDLHIQEMENFSSVCQRLGPLSTEVDEISADSMPPHTNILDSSILLKTKEKRSFDLHTQETRNIRPVCQRLGPLGTGVDETSAAEGTNVSIINPKGTKKVLDIEVSNAIKSAKLDAFTIEPEEHNSRFDISSTIATHVPPKTSPIEPEEHNSSFDISSTIATHVPPKTSSINGMSNRECAFSDASSTCTEALTNYVNSGSGSPSDGSSHSSENAVNHDPSFANEVNGIPCSTMTTVKVFKSLVCDLTASNRFPNNPRWSQDFEDEFNGHASFAHDHSSPVSYITDRTPDSLIKNGNVKNIIGDCPLDHSSSTYNHIDDTADSINSMPDIHSEISLLDVWSSKNSDNNVVGSTSSISESSSIISDTSSSSLFNIKYQKQKSNESNFTSSADETQGYGARKRYYEAVRCSSSRRERDFGCTFPGQDVCSIDEDSVAGDHPLHPTNSFERSEKKSGQQLRTPKVSTTNIAEPMDESLVKPKKKSAHKQRTPEVTTTNTAKPMDESLVKPTELLFPYEHFIKLFNWDCLELPPRGLINCGNSCFANVVLQCLTYTRPLAAYLLQGSHCGKCQRKDWCFMCELEHLVSRVKEGESALSPIRILSRIKSIGNHLGYGRQEDAHEFLRFAVDTMQSICLDEAGGEKSLHPISHLTTFIQQIFGGYLQSKVKCKKCHYESNRYEIMMDLTVEVNGNIMSLEDALKQFAAVELLDGDNKYKCDRCQSYVKAQKWLTVHEAPNILTIALKRFQTGSFGKLNKIVAFPEILDMSPYMSGTGDKPPLYRLYAVVVHLDVLNASYFGHYICYVKDLKGAWYKIDDSKVNPVAIDAVLSEGAYMLFYSRSSPRPPVFLWNEKVTNLKDVPVNQCTYDTKQSSLLGEHDVEADMHVNQFPSPGSCRVANIDKNQPASIKDLEKCSMDADSRIPDGLIPYSVRCGGLSPATQDRNDDFIAREYGDLTSSDSGSLFSGSDETSCSTDSNRDSVSTVDLAETIFRDHPRYIAYGSFYMGGGCGILSSCIESAQCPPKTDKILENKSPNHHLEKDRINENEVTWSNQSFTSQGIRHQRTNSSLSPCQPSAHSYVSEPSEHRDILDCGESAINRQRYIPHSHHFSVSESANCSKDNLCKDFAISAKWKHTTGRCKAKETKKLRLQTQGQTCTAATKFQHCVANDPGTSAFSSLHFLGFER